MSAIRRVNALPGRSTSLHSLIAIAAIAMEAPDLAQRHACKHRSRELGLDHGFGMMLPSNEKDFGADTAPARPNAVISLSEGSRASGNKYAAAAANKVSQISVVVPFFNEQACIAKTLTSLFEQELAPTKLVLVDNGSTDRSVAICKSVMSERSDIDVAIVHEERPGKIFALETALNHVTTEYVAFCDADTIYPRHYFRIARQLFSDAGDDLVAVMGLGINADPNSFKGLFQRLKGSFAGSMLAKQCHTGGFGQIFRTKALRAAGGYASLRWPYVLEDHEILHRILKQGRCRYHRDLWCCPSGRRTDRSDVTWTLFERIMYHCTPFTMKDWFFYRFLAQRFKKRGLKNINLREKSWSDEAV